MKASTKRLRRRIGWTAIAVVAALGTVCYAPSLLFFPHVAQVGDVRIHAEMPIDTAAMTAILAKADARTATSPIAAPLGSRSIYLTQGGWRWRILSLPSRGAFAMTRPFATNIVVNRNSIEGDAVENGAAIGGRRTLSGTIAHETTHLLIQRRYGALQARFFATWRVEGYCDHVAGESSLSQQDADRLHEDGRSTAALTYFDSRRRIEAEAASGSTVDQLLRGK